MGLVNGPCVMFYVACAFISGYRERCERTAVRVRAFLCGLIGGVSDGNIPRIVCP